MGVLAGTIGEEFGWRRSRGYKSIVTREFVYLAVVLDEFSRRVVGWNPARTLTARLPLGASEMALEGRTPATGLAQHSDRGAQYTHAEYLRTLRNDAKYSITIITKREESLRYPRETSGRY